MPADWMIRLASRSMPSVRTPAHTWVVPSGAAEKTSSRTFVSPVGHLAGSIGHMRLAFFVVSFTSLALTTSLFWSLRPAAKACRTCFSRRRAAMAPDAAGRGTPGTSRSRAGPGRVAAARKHVVAASPVPCAGTA
jgi:hypothetical protein